MSVYDSSDFLAKIKHVIVWGGRLPLSAPTTHLVGLKDKKEHVRRRIPWQRAMTPASIKHYEQFLTTRTQQLVDLLRQAVSAPVDMNQWMGYYTYVFFDILKEVQRPKPHHLISFDVMSDIV
jgi:cytochrome P450